MTIEVWRPGDYRVCPSCGARHKVQDIQCSRCRTVLVGTRVHHATAAPVAVAGARPSRGLRMVAAVGLIVALGAGFWVWSVFRGAQIEETVVASASAAPLPRPAESDWQPPVLGYPPVVGYNTGVPSSLAPLAIQGGADPGTDAPATGMVSIAPSSTPLQQRAFTDEDLARLREAGGAPVVSAPSAAAPSPYAVRPASLPRPPRAAAGEEPRPATPVPVQASAAVGVPSAAIAEAATRAVAVPGEDARKWIGRLHDRQEDVQKEQAKVRRLEVKAEAHRGRLAAATAEDDRKDAERDLMDALEDLEKAERRMARAQRELDETQERAREKGVRLER